MSGSVSNSLGSGMQLLWEAVAQMRSKWIRSDLIRYSLFRADAFRTDATRLTPFTESPPAVLNMYVLKVLCVEEDDSDGVSF